MRTRLLLILLVLATACTSGTPGATAVDPTGPGAAGSDGAVELGDTVLASALRRFDGCDALTGRLRSHALDQVGPYGLQGAGVGIAVAEEAAGDAVNESAVSGRAGGREDAAAVADAQAAAGDDFSTTNVQEAGVDEPDVAKTDGEWLYTVVDGALRVVDVRDDEPRLAATVTLDGGYARELLLHEGRVLVLGEGDPPIVDLPRPTDRSADIAVVPRWSPRARLWLVDVDRPDVPEVTSSMTVDGSLVSSRLTDGTAHVVLRSPVVPTGMVAPVGGRDSEQRAEAVNRQRIREADAQAWLPTVAVDDGDAQALVECAAVHEPPDFSELGMVTVLSLDPTAAALDPSRTQAVLGAADTVYASPQSLYVTTSRWPVVLPVEPFMETPAETATATTPAPPTITTEVHRFALEPDGATYTASGSVPGRLLNQFSMSEHDGHLRIATTEGEADLGARSSSAVRVLRERDGALVEVGHVGDLGRGERIFAVRYVGDLGFVVTFRQIDPLYTIDLSDPIDPRVLGELKIPGYSAYLHPVGDDRLLGVGQDADEQGRATGVQVSLFDVSDLSDPRRIAQAQLGEGTQTSVEFDHRAFLWWAPTDTAVLPAQDWQRNRAGAVAFRVDASDVTRRGTVEHPTPEAPTVRGPEPVPFPEDDVATSFAAPDPVQRALVVGDRLITVATRSVVVSDLSTLDRLGVVDW